MALNPNNLKSVRQRRYLAKDFDGLRAAILDYARQYYPDRLQDFSESSMGGLLLDMAAYVGDNLSFYLDHQFSELNYETAIETANVQRILRAAGVEIVGAAAATVEVTVIIEVPATVIDGRSVPDPSALPVVNMNSIFASDTGVEFILLEDIDFSKKNINEEYVAEIVIGQQSASGKVNTYIMAANGLAVSGKEITESLTVGSTFEPFKTFTLGNSNVSEIISVTDTLGNVYYQVGDLSQDVVYRNVLNTASDYPAVKDSIKIIPAPYRFVAQTDLATRKTTLTFGGGLASTLEDDVIPDPSEFAISLPYSKTFSRLSVNPQKLLSTRTLGVAATDTTVTITYRYGGGLDHNVPIDSIRTIRSLSMQFPNNPSAAVAARIRGSTEVTNRVNASGGEDAPSTDDLLALVPTIKNSQDRIVTRQDLLARIYSVPSNFGRVFRAAIRSNPNNPLATQLFIISRNPEGELITSPDSLKTNLVKYLNPYRMISDAIDILDARIINLGLTFDIVVDPSLNKSIILQNILSRLQRTFQVTNYNIDQPIVISEVVNTIFGVAGVLSIDAVKFESKFGTINNRVYNDHNFDVAANTNNNIIFPPPGGIFEIKYPSVDIVGRAI